MQTLLGGNIQRRDPVVFSVLHEQVVRRQGRLQGREVLRGVRVSDPGRGGEDDPAGDLPARSRGRQHDGPRRHRGLLSRRLLAPVRSGEGGALLQAHRLGLRERAQVLDSSEFSRQGLGRSGIYKNPKREERRWYRMWDHCRKHQEEGEPSNGNDQR